MPVQKGIGNFFVGVKIQYFRCSKGNFYARKKVSGVERFERSAKNRRNVGASCSVILRYLHPEKLIYERYSNKDKSDVIGGLIITQREVVTVTRRE